MNKPFQIVMLFLFCLSPFGIVHGGGQSYGVFFSTLNQASDHNDRIKVAKAKLRIARERIIQNRAALLPSLSFEYSGNYEYERWDGGKRETDPDSMALSFSMPLYDRQAWKTYQQAYPYVAAVEMDLHAVYQETNLQVIQEILTVLQAREVASLAKNNMEVTKRHLEATRFRHSVGELTHCCPVNFVINVPTL